MSGRWKPRSRLRLLPESELVASVPSALYHPLRAGL
jgi:hypothetical protein